MTNCFEWIPAFAGMTEAQPGMTEVQPGMMIAIRLKISSPVA